MPAVTQCVFFPRRVQSSAFFVLNSLVLSQPDGRRDLCLITHHLYFIIYHLPLCLWWAFHRSPTLVHLHLPSFCLTLSSSCHLVLFFTFDCLISLSVMSPFPPGTPRLNINLSVPGFVSIYLPHLSDPDRQLYKDLSGDTFVGETPARCLMRCMSGCHFIQHGLLCRVRHQP